MSILSRLFGGGTAAPSTPSVEHQGFTITATPIRDGNRYRISALIEKTVDGLPKSHTLIRADTLDDPEQAAEASVGKAKQLIDQQGERLFD